ncbi:RCC1 domain-containing protein [Pseudomonas knackmussii]|uniref:RCC1 domain-containing protein n=1 Tax=Pseudomonas knackmussii TaxID=65741 RepID=UPI001362AC71|nr:hypothetical protein [Pseudomonas knackmussii]
MSRPIEHHAQSPSPALASLPAPSVIEAEEGVLSSDALQATVEVVPYAGMAAGDRIDLLWKGNVSGEFTDWLPVSSATVGHPLTLTVASEYIASNNSAEVSYSVSRAAGGIEYSAVLQLRIGEALPLPAPSIDQAVDDKLNPADVPNGATVRVDAAANLQAGDQVTVHWEGVPGEGSGEYGHSVSGSEAGKAITVTVPFSVVEANKGNSIQLSYDVARAAGGTETSPVAVYDVTEQTGSGRLKVMGARSSLDAQSCYGDGGRRLVALDRDTLQPIEAQWRYEGDTTSVTGSSFQDSDRSRLLHVSTADDHVILNVANLCGPRQALVARRDEGNMVAWGDAANGGSVPPTIATMTDVVELTATSEAMAARRANSTVVTWGQAASGGTVPGEVNGALDIVQVVGSRPTDGGGELVPCAFAALRATQQVVAWGDSTVGGSVPSDVASLSDIAKVIGGGNAMAALRESGHVVAWGDQTAGGEVPQDIASLDDIVAVAGSFTAFAARRANGTVVAWGDTVNGGTVPSPINSLTDIVEVTPNHFAFAARRKNGTVVAWGNEEFGGSIPSPIDSLNDIVEVVGTGGAFAARRANNTVVAWGKAPAATVPSAIASMTDIIAITSGLYAFAALRSNGEVVAWGDLDLGGDTSDVAAELFDVRAIYAGGYAFAALCEDKRVVTWGDSERGGNSDDVASVLNGHVSYEATAVSRGIGRRRK